MSAPARAGVDAAPRPFPPWGWGCGAFVLMAVVTEMVSGAWANSPVPAWAERVAPLAWPAPARVVWWVAVAAAAAGFRAAEAVAGIRRSRWVVAASVVPFIAFAAGIAAGAPWATWH